MSFDARANRVVRANSDKKAISVMTSLTLQGEKILAIMTCDFSNGHRCRDKGCGSNTPAEHNYINRYTHSAPSPQLHILCKTEHDEKNH
jgi:hypothetical protein